MYLSFELFCGESFRSSFQDDLFRVLLVFCSFQHHRLFLEKFIFQFLFVLSSRIRSFCSYGLFEIFLLIHSLLFSNLSELLAALAASELAMKVVI